MNPIALRLAHDYGWHTTSPFTGEHLDILLQSALDLRAFLDENLNGAGFPWMRRWLSPVYFHLGGLPHIIVSWIGRQKTSVVFPQRHVWLSPRFHAMANPRQHIIHELAHVMDNAMAGRWLPASLFGGGPADMLVRELGGMPKGIRFSNGTCGIPTACRWAASSGGGYGNRATAEYFAESIAWSLYGPAHLPSPSITGWLQNSVLTRMD